MFSENEHVQQRDAFQVYFKNYGEKLYVTNH